MSFTLLDGSDFNIIFDETYANGNGTDSWCSTDILVPTEMHKHQTYPNPKCDQWSCSVGTLHVLATPPHLYTEVETSRSVCSDRTLPWSYPILVLCIG